MTVVDVATLTKKDAELIIQWETGESKPSLAQLEKLAYKVFKLPLAVFYLPFPPEELPLNKQFRTISNEEINALPYQFMLKANQAQYYQEVLKELFNGRNPVAEPIFNTIKANTGNISSVANQVRQVFGINKQQQISFKDDYAAFNFYREKLENAGVFVFQQSLEAICRGYSLMDKEFPVIIVNSSEYSVKGRIFTLFHELSHLLFHTGGITKNDFVSDDKTEIACNKLASSILLSNDDLLTEDIVVKSISVEWSDEDLKYLSNRFQLSQEFILRRLTDLGKSSSEFYGFWRKKRASIDPAIKKEGRGTFYINTLSKLGKNYTRSVLQTFYEGRITDQNVSDYLGIKINQIPEFEKRVYA